MPEEQTEYLSEDLAGLNDQQLLEKLKESWGYELDKPIFVIGKIKVKQRNEHPEKLLKTIGAQGAQREIPVTYKIDRRKVSDEATERSVSPIGVSKDLNEFYVLEDLHSINDGSVLVYPLKGQNILNNVFVRNIKRHNLQSGQWVKARVLLSPEYERVKRKNPFALTAVDGAISLLEDLPEVIKIDDYYINGKLHIESWIVDFYQWKNNENIKKNIEQEREHLLTNFNREKNRIENEVQALGNSKKILADLVENSQIELENNKKELEKLTAEKNTQVQNFSRQREKFNNKFNELEIKLNKLTEYIRNTAEMLLDLDLISQADVENLLGKNMAKECIIGHDFETVFDLSEKQAVSYIQAFMYNKDILYRRSVLEDFFALVRTNDIIILAGDSGSGKTNLVKSFAEASGGKAFIIPVKPNWTSAEDLIGYYNPLEQKYLTTPFLDALFEAKQNPDIPYFICLDEMNLARVEYYFADFLSLLEERKFSPEISLYSDSESENLLSETRNFLALINNSKLKMDKLDLISFLDLMRDEQVNAKLHELCGFREGDSLLKYHARLRKMLQSYLSTPAKLEFPSNVRIIGAINVDETTHYLSPKILDRAHLMRFSSPLLTDLDEIEQEIEYFDIDMSLPVSFQINQLGVREPYPAFDRNDVLMSKLIYLTKEYLDRLGIEFGMRTVRQARHYQNALLSFGVSDEVVFNNIILHKVLPKMMFDGEKLIDKNLRRKDLLNSLKDYLQKELPNITSSPVSSCIDELDRVIRNAESNDWIVNYWSR